MSFLWTQDQAHPTSQPLDYSKIDISALLVNHYCHALNFNRLFYLPLFNFEGMFKHSVLIDQKQVSDASCLQNSHNLS